jgi:hypothetical protein
MNAVPLSDLKPGSPEWMTRMTASKVAAVLGLSPWESRFSLAYAHADRPWQASSPDRLALTHGAADPVAVVEVKTTADGDEWGVAGTDEIPPYYRAQVVWQLDTLGLPVGYVAVLLPRLEFREYRIDYNADEAAYIRAEARAFLDTLPGGINEQRPDLDAHSATYAAVQQLHPGIDGESIDVPDHIGREFCDAIRDLSAAKEREQAARTVLADHMGDAKAAKWLGKTIADRRVKTGGTPYMQAASVKRLPIEAPEGIAS